MEFQQGIHLVNLTMNLIRNAQSYIYPPSRTVNRRTILSWGKKLEVGTWFRNKWVEESWHQNHPLCLPSNFLAAINLSKESCELGTTTNTGGFSHFHAEIIQAWRRHWWHRTLNTTNNLHDLPCSCLSFNLVASYPSSLRYTVNWI